MGNIIEDIDRIEKMPIFFILSRGRSGSTLLRTLLDAHPNISIPFLSEFMQYLYFQYHSVKWNEQLVLSFYNDLLKLPKTHYLNFNKDKLKEDLLFVNKEYNNKISFALLCKIVLLNFISVYEKNTIKIVGSKGHDFFFLKESLELFPNAKFIHLVRDYRDNILSILNQDFKVSPEPKILIPLAYKWKYRNKYIMHFKYNNPDLVRTIKYEEFVTDTVLHLKEICKFLDIEYNNQMLDYYPKVLKYRDMNMKLEHHESLFSAPINPSRISSWKTRMSTYDVKMADFIVGSFAEEMGYKRAYTQKNILFYFIVMPVIGYFWCYNFIKYIFSKQPVIIKHTRYAILRKIFLNNFLIFLFSNVIKGW